MTQPEHGGPREWASFAAIVCLAAVSSLLAPFIAFAADSCSRCDGSVSFAIGAVWTTSALAVFGALIAIRLLPRERSGRRVVLSVIAAAQLVVGLLAFNWHY